ncbi:MAG TPA: hypothetical protein VGG98_09955 [Solirubrobacteraceae bacterium]
MEIEVGNSQHERHKLAELVVANIQAVRDGVGIDALAFDPGCLFCEQLLGDFVPVVLLEKLALFLFEPSEESFAAAYLLLAGGSELSQPLLDQADDAVAVMSL